jgi:hypothetical protein
MASHIHTKFPDDQFSNWSNMNSITSTTWEAVVLVLLRGISYVRCWNVLRWRDIIPSLMTTDSGIRVILTVLPQQTEGGGGYNVGIPDERDLLYSPLTWPQVVWYTLHTKFHEDWHWHSSNVKIFPKIWEASMLVLLMGWIYDVWCWHGIILKHLWILFRNLKLILWK